MTELPPFAAPYAPRDEDFAARFLAARPDAAAEQAIEEKARALIRSMRAARGALGGVEDFLHEFSLSTR
jgi:RHH-type transcriptional regulator, proline utilization regulon repressor / proline dehydrogenase / delta 1-pyrroline-5-carboxylate dehydrogenase